MKGNSKIIKIIWWVYIILLLAVVVVKFKGSFVDLTDRINEYSDGENYNLEPFVSIKMQIEYFSQGWARLNLFGNIIPFMPFGCLLPVVYPKTSSFIKVFIIGFLFILSIETFQFFTKLGVFDVDDIILNMIGICMGYFMSFPFRKK